jgi:hypothetical protein
LLDIPYFDIDDVKAYYQGLIKDYGGYSNNSFRLGSPDWGTIVRDRERAVKYVCKYMSAAINVSYQARCYSCTRELIKRPIKLTGAQVRALQPYIEKYRKFDYCTVVHLTNKQEFYKYFAENCKKQQKRAETIKIVRKSNRNQTEIKQKSNRNQTEIKQKTTENNKRKAFKIQ